MAAFPEMHIASDRFAEYVADLREFSGTHRVPCGKPEDLTGLVEALRSSPAFAMDFGSMMRSIVLNEHFQASESELITLVAIAWGGPIADDSTDHVPRAMKDLGRILADVLRRGAGEAGMIPIPPAEDSGNVSPDVQEPAEETEQINADVPASPQSLAVQAIKESKPEREGPGQIPEPRPSEALVQREEPAASVTVREPRKHRSRNQDVLVPTALDRISVEQDAGNSPQASPVAPRFGELAEPSPARLLEPSAPEIIATALTGLVVALLLNVATLPVYRTRVSVYLPPAATTAANSAANPSEASLRDGRLTEQVAQRLLVRPLGSAILRQDAISRGLRDLHLGGAETILYANLVAATAHQVTVKRIEPQNLYEITCDSWSPQFAATFCNELISVLEEHPSQPGADAVRAVDAATGPGIQVYPQWNLQGAAGLAVGTLVGVLLGFVKRPSPKAIAEDENAG